MTGFKPLFQRSLAAAPERLHMAAHSHHLWPDASYVGQLAAWDDAARLADGKWDRVIGELWPAAQGHVAAELNLPDPSTIVFAGNTHDFLLRVASAIDARPLRILATDGEFHSFARQSVRWEEAGVATVERVAVEPFDTFADRFLAAAGKGGHDLVWISQTLFGSGRIAVDLAPLRAPAQAGAQGEQGEGGGARLLPAQEHGRCSDTPAETGVHPAAQHGRLLPGGLNAPALAAATAAVIVVDGYHGFMALETDLCPLADRLFYTAGGYKYAMAGEGVAFLHAPAATLPRPVQTGWYAAFAALERPGEGVPYADDAMRFMGSTFDPSGLYRFVAVRDMLAQEGLTTAAISVHVAGLMARLEDGLAATPLADATVLNPARNGARARFLALRHARAGDWQRALGQRGVVTDVRGDVLRIGLGLYHDARDVDRFLSIARDLG